LGYKDEVIPTFEPLVVATAKRFKWAVGKAGVDMGDLISEAWIGLIKAFEHYNPSPGKSAKFSTYAAPWVQGEIRKFLRDKATIARPSQRLYSFAGLILKGSLEQDSAFVISGKLACSPKAANEALRYLRESKSASLNHELPGDDGEGSSLLDKLGVADDLSQLCVNEFLASLTAEEQAFIQMRAERIQPNLYAAEEVERLLKKISEKCVSYMNVTESEVRKMSVTLTKEKYLELKKQGVTDDSVMSSFHLSKAVLYRHKKMWEIPLKRGGDYRSKKHQAAKSSNASAPALKTEPISEASPNVVKAPAIQDSDIVKQLQTRIEQLEHENVLLKGLVKIYL
jgi:RNA polymerase sigma factor (sigma-70 family)